MAQEDMLRKAAEILIKIAQEKEDSALSAIVPDMSSVDLGDTGLSETTTDEEAVQSPEQTTEPAEVSAEQPSEQPSEESEDVVLTCDGCDHSAPLSEVNATNSELGYETITKGDKVSCPSCGGVMSAVVAGGEESTPPAVEEGPSTQEDTTIEELPKEAGVVGSLFDKAIEKIKRFTKGTPPAVVEEVVNMEEGDLKKLVKEGAPSFLDKLFASLNSEPGPGPDYWGNQQREKEYEIRTAFKNWPVEHRDQLISYLIAKGLELGIVDKSKLVPGLAFHHLEYALPIVRKELQNLRSKRLDPDKLARYS